MGQQLNGLGVLWRGASCINQLILDLQNIQNFAVDFTG